MKGGNDVEKGPLLDGVQGADKEKKGEWRSQSRRPPGSGFCLLAGPPATHQLELPRPIATPDDRSGGVSSSTLHDSFLSLPESARHLRPVPFVSAAGRGSVGRAH